MTYRLLAKRILTILAVSDLVVFGVCALSMLNGSYSPGWHVAMRASMIVGAAAWLALMSIESAERHDDRGNDPRAF